jgi:hypothetical protein
MISLDAWDAVLKEADDRMKQSNGHSYVTILKTRCQRCGRSPRQKGICRFWFLRTFDTILEVLNERDVTFPDSATGKR